MALDRVNGPWNEAYVTPGSAADRGDPDATVGDTSPLSPGGASRREGDVRDHPIELDDEGLEALLTPG